MDPVDREKPWNVLEQVAVITLAIGMLYMIVRFAVVVPDWGWQLILAVTFVGVLTYYLLAFRFGFRRKQRARSPTRAQKIRELITALLLIVALTLPVAIALFYLSHGWQL